MDRAKIHLALIRIAEAKRMADKIQNTKYRATARMMAEDISKLLCAALDTLNNELSNAD